MKFRDQVPSSDGGQFLRLKDGESVQGIFLGNPYEFFAAWEKGKGILVKEGDPGGKFRFRLNFIVKENNQYVAKIFENGPTVYRTLKDINNEYQGLENVIVKITRHGTELQTEYQIMPTRHQVPPEALKVKLLDLGHDPKKNGGAHNQDLNDFGPPPPDIEFNEHSELPF